MTRRALLLVALVGWGCGGDDDDDGAGDAGVDAGDAAFDGGPDGDAGADAGSDPTHVTVGPTASALGLPFGVDVGGAGTDRIGAVEIVAGTGTVQVGAESLATVVYERQAWPDFGYDLYQALAVDADGWVLLWLYCQGETLAFVYSEDVTGLPLEVEPAAGTCSVTERDTIAEVRLPGSAFDVLLAGDGFSVDGPAVRLDGAAPGQVQLGGLSLDVLVFATVDCTTDCGAPGWWELHAVLVDRTGERACVGIFYLMLDGSPVLLTYSLTLPDLSDPAGLTELAADWTAPS